MHERSSTIDLTWYNDAAIEDTVFSNWALDWEGSLGSDHALTRVQDSLPGPIQPPQKDTTELGYALNEDKGTEWCQQFKDAVGFPVALPEKPQQHKLTSWRTKSTRPCNTQPQQQ